MIFCDVSPLTYDILTQSLGVGTEGDIFRTEMPASVYNKISHVNLGSLSAYFSQKTKEYVHMLLLAKYLAEEKGKTIKFNLSLFTNDIMNGVDVRFCINNSCRISADLTALNLLDLKILKHNNHMRVGNTLSKGGKGRAGDIGHKTGMLLIGIPTQIHYLANTVINNSETIEDARDVIDEVYPKNQEAMREIVIIGLDKHGKKWAAKHIYN